jgi:hypothetical protein
MFGSNLCVICYDSISDPVCRSCYIKQLGILLDDLKIRLISAEAVLDKIKRRFPVDTLNDTSCILCRRENVSMCGYCFTIVFRDTLRELGFGEELIEEFGYSTMYKEDFIIV